MAGEGFLSFKQSNTELHEILGLDAFPRRIPATGPVIGMQDKVFVESMEPTLNKMDEKVGSKRLTSSKFNVNCKGWKVMIR